MDITPCSLLDLLFPQYSHLTIEQGKWKIENIFELISRIREGSSPQVIRVLVFELTLYIAGRKYSPLQLHIDESSRFYRLARRWCMNIM